MLAKSNYKLITFDYAIVEEKLKTEECNT